jgi:TPP-dependent pyruvate/acetoin dehydrogenase alpha subunit
VTKQDLIDFENDIKNEFIQGDIRHPIHLSAGNEQNLIEIFNKYKIGKEDFLFSTHRSHYHALLKGIPKEWLKQQIITGHSMHLMSKEYKFFASSIVGGSIPIAVGVALAIKRQGFNERVFVFLGDMCAETGTFFECLKYAQCFDLPICFIIEDNNMSTNTPTDKTFNEHKTNFKGINKVDFYKYTRECEHINTKEWVEFR